MRTWKTEDRRYVQILVWLDEGEKISPLKRTEFPENRFKDFEDADKYSESFGGYCSGLAKIRGNNVWILWLREEKIEKDETTKPTPSSKPLDSRD